MKLPGSSESVIISEHNALGDMRYFDSASQTSFEVDHASQKASATQQHPLESTHADLVRSLLKAFKAAAAEHFPSYTIGVYPAENDTAVSLVLVANKYSPQNFWNGRWRGSYLLNPSSNTLSGMVKADVHYYEDGNVRMSTSKKLELGSGAGDVESIVREIAKAENKFQEELNRAFVTLAEGSFKSLRRQLPVTRQRVDWEKIGGYRVRCPVSIDISSSANFPPAWPRHWRRSFEIAAFGNDKSCSTEDLRLEPSTWLFMAHNIF